MCCIGRGPPYWTRSSDGSCQLPATSFHRVSHIMKTSRCGGHESERNHEKAWKMRIAFMAAWLCRHSMAQENSSSSTRHYSQEQEPASTTSLCSGFIWCISERNETGKTFVRASQTSICGVLWDRRMHSIHDAPLSVQANKLRIDSVEAH